MKMSYINYFLIVALLAFVSAWAQNPLPAIGLPSRENLAQLFFSSSVTRRNPQLSAVCFGGYISESNIISRQYSLDYSRCHSVAQDGRARADHEFQPQLHQILASAEQVCERLSECNGKNATLDAFRCHANGGGNNSVAAYTISTNASEHATLLQERFRVIDLRYNQCIVIAERLYIKLSANNYKNLQACLNGQAPPNQIQTSTQAPATPTWPPTIARTTRAPPTTRNAGSIDASSF